MNDYLTINFRRFKGLLIVISFTTFTTVDIGFAQNASSQATSANAENYNRIIGQVISSIFPPPEGTYDLQKYQNQYNKTVKKLEGEANEELVTSLMALGSTYTPDTANELAEIISRSNNLLTNEEGAVNANAILTAGLDELQIELEGTSILTASLQIDVLQKHKESLILIKQAIQNKLTRFEDYIINQQSIPLIDEEAISYNLCENGTAPIQNGLSNIIGFLNSTHAGNLNSINTLTGTINTDLSAYPLALSSSIAELETLIADPATTPIQVMSLETIKENMETKAQLIQDNLDITACNTAITPKVAEPAVIKADEDTFLVGVMNSILDTGSSITIPPIPTNYTTFDIAPICTTLPASVTSEVNAVKTNCTNWINYYKSPYIISDVNVDASAAIGDQRYLTISNCGKPGRTCSAAPMTRLGNEMKALAVFPMGRLIVAEMILQSIDKVKLFYNDLLFLPELYDCDLLTNQDLLAQHLARKDCNNDQKESSGCATGLGIDCDRAEIGYLLYKLKSEIFLNNNVTETTQNQDGSGAQAGQSGDNSSTGEIGFTGGTNSKASDNSPVSFVSLSTNTNTETANLNKSANIAENSNDKGNTVNFANNTAFNNLTLSKIGAQVAGRGSFKTINRFFKKKFKLNKKLKGNFINKSSDSIANAITQNFSGASIEKFAKSFGGKQNLFASAKLGIGTKEKDPRGSQAAQVTASSYRPQSFKTNYRFQTGPSNISPRKSSTEPEPNIEDNLIEIETYPGSNNKRRNGYLAKIHTNKIGLFEIISRRYRRTDIYFENTY
jgi:hypothetical protein